MSADADDLLERAARALDRDIPTIDEVTVKLAAALDELERDFPDGKPGDGATGSPRLRYWTLIGKVTHCRWQLENGQCVEFPRGRPSRVGSDPSWDEFIDAHPELTGEHSAVAAGEPLSFTDVELLRALRSACRNRDRRMPRDRRGEGVLSCSVAQELAGVTFVRGQGLVPRDRVPSHRDVTKVGVALARLARAGRVTRTNRKWETNRWAPTARGVRAA